MSNQRPGRFGGVIRAPLLGLLLIAFILATFTAVRRYRLGVEEKSRRLVQAREEADPLSHRANPGEVPRVSTVSGQLNVSLSDPADRRPAPDFALADLGGRLIRLSDYRGKVVLIDFFRTDCQPCLTELPRLVDLGRRLEAEGVQVLGVSLSPGGAGAVRPLVRESRVGFPVLVDEGTASSLYGPIETLPTTVVIDCEGGVAARIEGPKEEPIFEAIVKRVLQED